MNGRSRTLGMLAWLMLDFLVQQKKPSTGDAFLAVDLEGSHGCITMDIKRTSSFSLFSLLSLRDFLGNVSSFVIRFWKFYQDVSISHFFLNKCLQYLTCTYRPVWANHAVRKLINMSPSFSIKEEKARQYCLCQIRFWLVCVYPLHNKCIL